MVEKLEFSIGIVIKILGKKKKCTNDKAKQTFLRHLPVPVPVQQAVKSFKVVIIPVLCIENICTCRFPVNLYFKPV